MSRTGVRPSASEISADVQPKSDPTGLAEGSRVLAQNTVLTIVSQGLPLVVGLLLTPFILGRLGKDGFGALSIGWTVLTLSLVFNFGLGRATTKYAADYLMMGRLDRISALFWLSVFLNVVFGLVGSVLVGGGSMLLVASHVLRIPDELARDVSWMFVALAFALPFTFVTTTMRGMLEAGQHFRGMSVARLTFNTAVFALPALTLVFSNSLAIIGLALTASRAAEMVVYSWLCLRRYPLLWPYQFSTRQLRPLLVYGGWLTVTNMLLPLILSMDRFIVGALISVQAVAFYAVPTELVTRLAILPASLIVPLFPAFAALNESGDHARLIMLYLRSMKHVAVGMGLVAALVIVMAEPFLQAWVGREFARESAFVMQIAAMSILVNSIGFLPGTVLQAVGLPDLTAKAHLIETPIAVATMWYLTRKYGIAGTAVAWGLRGLLDTIILTAVTGSKGYLTFDGIRNSRLRMAVALVAGLVAAAWGLSLLQGLVMRTGAFLLLVITWAALVLAWALDRDETQWLRDLPTLFRSRLKESHARK